MDGRATGAIKPLGLWFDSLTNKDKMSIRLTLFSSGGSAGWVSWQRDGRDRFDRRFACFLRDSRKKMGWPFTKGF